MDDNDNFAIEEQTAKENFIEEIYPQVDPETVQKELLEQFKEMQANMPPADVAAHFFQLYWPIFKGLISGLSNKDARRVAEHLVQWPLEEANPHFSNDKAKQAFQVGIRLLDCKMIMKSVVEMERLANVEAEKAKQMAEQKATEVVEQKQGEETNG